MYPRTMTSFVSEKQFLSNGIASGKSISLDTNSQGYEEELITTKHAQQDTHTGDVDATGFLHLSVARYEGHPFKDFSKICHDKNISIDLISMRTCNVSMA